MKTLSNEIRDFIARGYDAPRDEARFDELRSRLKERQPYLGGLEYVPTDLFARRTIAAFDPRDAVAVFESSGTTKESRSRHHFRDLSLYRAASMAGARYALGERKYRVERLFAAEHSSLSKMIDWIEEDFSGEGPDLIIGPAFAYVDIEGRALAPGSIVIETGGYKGKTREIPKPELYKRLSQKFQIDEARILSEYGMCEISSPLWERPGDRGWRVPPWVRVRLVDPENMKEAERGVILIEDLANIDSSVGILTSDVGRFENGRLIFEGRLTGVAEKGCSLLL